MSETQTTKEPVCDPYLLLNTIALAMLEANAASSKYVKETCDHLAKLYRSKTVQPEGVTTNE